MGFPSRKRGIPEIKVSGPRFFECCQATRKPEAPMRRSVLDQLPLVPAPHAHAHVRELQEVRAVLDVHPEFAKWVQADLLAGGIDATRGRTGMSGEQALRALVIKQAHGFSYEELALHLADS